MEVVKRSNLSLNKAQDAFKKGGVIICPTDTVYGFLALASNKRAVKKIFKIKRRPKSKPLAVFAKDFTMAKKLAEIDAKQEKILRKYWPGKYTFVLKRRKGIKLFDGAKKTIALRIPKYVFLNNLIKKINKPLVQTSVNISGRPALIKAKEIIKQFKTGKLQPDIIIDAGNLLKGRPSAIMDLTKNNIKFLRK